MMADGTDAEICIRKEKLAEILRQLERKQDQCEKLHRDNEALAAQIAEQKVRLQTMSDSTAPSLESMTWEERKSLILQQLENEEGGPGQRRQHLIDVVAETDRVVKDRDRELSELRELLRQQPKPSEDGTAVGALAIAGLLDADPLIQEEREQLEALKNEWTEKMRQGEIELSLERARLARQEYELNKKLMFPDHPAEEPKLSVMADTTIDG